MSLRGRSSREPKAAGSDWTEERGACDERRGKELPQGRPEASGEIERLRRATREGAASRAAGGERGNRAPATSDEGRRRLKGGPEASGTTERAGPSVEPGPGIPGRRRARRTPRRRSTAGRPASAGPTAARNPR